jgi:hypothetical protein
VPKSGINLQQPPSTAGALSQVVRYVDHDPTSTSKSAHYFLLLDFFSLWEGFELAIHLAALFHRKYAVLPRFAHNFALSKFPWVLGLIDMKA